MEFLTPLDGLFNITSNSDNGARVTTPLFSLNFAAPFNASLTTGFFEDARRFPFQPFGQPGLSVNGDGRGSNTLTGQFEIFEIEFDTAGNPIALDAIFEQHSEGRDPALFGRIRINASPVPEPSGLGILLLCLVFSNVRYRRN